MSTRPFRAFPAVRVSLPLLAALSLVAAASPARADIVSTHHGNPLAAQFYLSQAYAEIKDGSGNLLDSGGRIHDNSANMATASESGNLGASGSGLGYSTLAALDAFGHARLYAAANVTNTAANFGYNVVASRGSRTQAFFDSSATPGKVVFNFAVTGSASSPHGLALGRLDFLARAFTPGSGSFFDVFGGEALHANAAGNYSFTYLGSTAQPLDILFYAAAAIVTQDSPMPGGVSFSAFADFANTFNLTSIELYDTNDQLIEDWTLIDEATGTAVFNQDGRIGEVPEPASAVLLVGAGLATLRRRPRKP